MTDQELPGCRRCLLSCKSTAHSSTCKSQQVRIPREPADGRIEPSLHASRLLQLCSQRYRLQQLPSSCIADNYFVITQGGPFTFPTAIRVTSILSDTVQDTVQTNDPSSTALIRGSAQFPLRPEYGVVGDASPTTGTGQPTASPTPTPSTSAPTRSPTSGPTSGPAATPTAAPTRGPTAAPAAAPTAGPSSGGSCSLPISNYGDRFTHHERADAIACQDTGRCTDCHLRHSAYDHPLIIPGGTCALCGLPPLPYKNDGNLSFSTGQCGGLSGSCSSARPCQDSAYPSSCCQPDSSDQAFSCSRSSAFYYQASAILLFGFSDVEALAET